MQNNVASVIGIVLPVLAVLLLGYISRIRGILSATQVDGLKTFVVTFTLPAVLFGAFYRIDYTRDVLLIVLLIYAVCVIAYFAGKASARFVPGGNALLPFVTTGFEAGMMGYALYTMIFGAAQLPVMATVALGGDLFVFTLYMALLKRRNGISAGQMVKETFASPIFCAIAAGVLLGATGLGAKLSATQTGEVLQKVLDFLAAPTSCAILFVVGYGIDFSGGAVREAARSAIVRLVVMALLCALTLFLCKLLPTTDSYRMWAVILLFSLPGPYVLPVFVKGGENERYAATCLSLYTLLSVVLFCIIASIAV